MGIPRNCRKTRKKIRMASAPNPLPTKIHRTCEDGMPRRVADLCQVAQKLSWLNCHSKNDYPDLHENKSPLPPPRSLRFFRFLFSRERIGTIGRREAHQIQAWDCFPGGERGPYVGSPIRLLAPDPDENPNPIRCLGQDCRASRLLRRGPDWKVGIRIPKLLRPPPSSITPPAK